MANGKKKNKNKGGSRNQVPKPISGQVTATTAAVSAAGGVGVTSTASPPRPGPSTSKDTSSAAAAKKAAVLPVATPAVATPDAVEEKKAQKPVAPASLPTPTPAAAPLKQAEEGKEGKEGSKVADIPTSIPSAPVPSSASSSSEKTKPANAPTAPIPTPTPTPASTCSSSSSTMHPLSSSSSSSSPSETARGISPKKTPTRPTAEEAAALPIPPPLGESDDGTAAAAAVEEEEEEEGLEGGEEGLILPASPPHLRPESVKATLQEGLFTLKMLDSRLVSPPGGGSSYTEYLIKCYWGFELEHAKSWVVNRRYSEFSAFDLALRSALPPSLPPSLLPLPPKERFWVDSNGPAVVNKRKKGLEEYLLRLLSHLPEALPSPTLDAFLHLTARIDRIKQMLGRSPPPPSSPSFFAYDSPTRSARPQPSTPEREGGREGGKEGGRVVLPTYIHNVDLRRLSSTAAYLTYETKSISPLSAEGLAAVEGRVGRLKAALEKIDEKKDFMQDTYLCDLLNGLMLDWPSLKALTNTIQEEEEEEGAGEEKEKGKALEALLDGHPLLGRALTCDTTLASLVSSLRETLYVRYGEKE